MKSNHPLVSVIIPTYNSSNTLEKCLQSVKEQTYPNIEIIVIDNFSQDGTDIIASQMGTLIQVGPERSAQVNVGARHAKGEFLYRIDGDMILENTVVQACIEKIRNENLDAIAVPNRSTGEGYWQQVRILERETYLDDELIVAARFLKKTAFLSVGGMDETLIASEDYDLHNRLLKAGFKIGRITPCEYHLGDSKHLWEYAIRSFHYGPSRISYIKKHPLKGMKQMSPLRKSYFRHWRELLAKPSLLAGLCVLKVVEYFFTGLGIFANGLGLINNHGRFAPRALAALLLVIISLLSMVNSLPEAGFRIGRIGLGFIFVMGLLIWRILGERRSNSKNEQIYNSLLDVSLAFSPLLLLVITKPSSFESYSWRIWQILTTFVLSIVIGWFIFLADFKSPEIKNNHRKNRTNNFILGILIISFIIFVAIMSLTSLKLLETFSLSPYELAGVDQALWSSWQNRSRLSMSTLLTSSIYKRSIFAFDPSPAFLLLLPAYAIGLGGPELLLISQSLALGIGALALYRIGSKRIGHFPALLVTLAYLFYFLTIRLSVGRFYILTWSVPLILFAFEAKSKQRWVMYYIFLVLSLMCGLEVSFIVISLGIYYLLTGSKRNHSLMTILLGVTWLSVMLFAFVPFYGGTPSEALGWITLPIKKTPLIWLVNRLFRFESFSYLLEILSPTSVIPILQPQMLIPTLPRLIMNLLIENPTATGLSGRFEITLIPFLFISTISGIEWLNKKSQEKNWGQIIIPAAMVVIVSAIISTHLLLPDILSPLLHSLSAQDAKIIKTGHQIITQIETNASIATQSPFAIELAHRNKLTILPDANEPNYIFFDVFHPNREPMPSSYHEALLRTFNNPLYGLRSSQYGYLLFERGLDPITKTQAFKSVVFPKIQHEADIKLNETIAYRGFDLSATEVKPGELLFITHYWESIKPTPIPYQQFTAFPGGQIFESIAFGLLSPNQWGPGEIIQHKQIISLPSLPDGDDYEIAVGLWFSESKTDNLSPDQFLGNNVIRIAKILVNNENYTILPILSTANNPQ